MSGCWVERSTDEGREQEVEQRVPSEAVKQCSVVGNLHDKVQYHHPSHGRGLDEGGTEGIEGQLEEEVQGLEGGAVLDDAGLDGMGNVGVHPVDALVAVVVHVIRLERGRVRDANGQVGQDRPELVGPRMFESQVVRPFVDGQEQRMVGRSTNQVDYGEKDGPR